MQTDELELIAQSLRHDADAYGQLVERYKNALYRHCFALVRDEATAEDIAQETFITAYYKLTQFDTSRRFSTWLFKIATNKALTHLKRTKVTLPLDTELVSSVVSASESLERQAEFAELHTAVAQLQPKYRAVISLYYWQGLPYEEIALALDVPVGTVKGWMNRAKSQLRKELI